MSEKEKGRVAVITPVTRYPGFDTISEGEKFIKDQKLRNSVARVLQKPIKPDVVSDKVEKKSDPATDGTLLR